MSTYRFTKSNLNETLELVYSYIVSYVKKEGYPPSVREICQGVGIYKPDGKDFFSLIPKFSMTDFSTSRTTRWLSLTY